MEKVIDRIIKTSLYLLVFLLPIFFLPLTIFPIAWNKQILLAVICFLVSVLWLIKIIKTGKLSLVWNKVSSAALILLVVLGISTFFSMAKAQSFWGTSAEPDSFFSFILYGLTFFLFANLISGNQPSNQREISVLKVIRIFLLSSGILALLFLIQEIFGLAVPDFLISVQALAVFFGAGFVIVVTLINANIEKVLGMIIGLLLFVSILLINFWPVWLGIALVMVIILWAKLKSLGRKKEIVLRDYILPVVVFAVALILIFIKIPFSNILDLPTEITLTNKAGFDISKKTLGENFKNLIIGSGPATFGYDYRLYRSADINLGSFWYLRFEQGPSALITLLATSGILGILGILLLMATFFYLGIKNISGNQLTSAKISVLVGGAYFLILWIFYSINFSLMFAGFLMLGLWMASLNKTKEISLVRPPQKAFFSMLGAIILMVVLVAGFYVYTQKYSAALSFSRGVNLINAEEPDSNGAIISISKSVSFDKINDKYLRELSQVILFRINEVLSSQELSRDQRNEELQNNLFNVQAIVQKAIQINPKDSLNWLQAGQIYESIISLKEGSGESAILAYRKAIELDPLNPQIPFNLGRVYKTIAQKIRVEDLSNQAIELAIDNFQKSIELKYNFTPAYYLLGRIYEMTMQDELAIQNYQIVLRLEPTNEEVRERLDKLLK